MHTTEAGMDEQKERQRVDLTPGKRCSDFDKDCAFVQNHYICWRGGTFDQWERADGYCPYLVGQCSASR